MKIVLCVLVMFFVLFIGGCDSVDVSKLSDKDLKRISSELVVCNEPYIRFAATCCLDKDNNSICDKDESQELNKTQSTYKSKVYKTNMTATKTSTNYKVDAYFGSRSGVKTDKVLRSAVGSDTYFYLWYVNELNKAIVCNVTEYYPVGDYNSKNDDWVISIAPNSKNKTRILIEPFKTKSYVTLTYAIHCSDEFGALGSFNRYISINYS